MINFKVLVFMTILVLLTYSVNSLEDEGNDNLQDIAIQNAPPKLVDKNRIDLLTCTLSSKVEELLNIKITGVREEMNDNWKKIIECDVRTSYLENTVKNLQIEINKLKSKNQVKDSKDQVKDSKDQVKDSKDQVNDSKDQVKDSKDQVKDSKDQVKDSKDQVDDSKDQVNEVKVIKDPRYDENFKCLENCKPTGKGIVKDCKHAMPSDSSTNGLYILNIRNSSLEPFYAYCERRENLIWTVIQRREDNTVDFYRNWTDYRNGFGDLDGEFWLGLERLHHMTKNRLHELYIRMIDENGYERYARYKKFSIADEASKYQLTIGSYIGTAGDSLILHNGVKFSTSDNRNDNSANTQACADIYKGAWWFKDCLNSHLNGLFYSTSETKNIGIAWDWFNKNLRFSEMMIRSL